MLVAPPTAVIAGLRRALGGVLHETHASWVLVTDDRAIKVKKPVVLPFLDYGTLERRRTACVAEVALNRRLAPAVYLDAVAIVPSCDELGLAPVDDPGAIEYAVLMRRYAEADTLAARVTRGSATLDDAERVGACLARFHAETERVDPDHGAEPIERWMDDNNASLRALLPAGSDRARVADAERFAAAFLTARWTELDERARAGRVRDGHGDLRAEHIVLEGGEVVVVDCIEFDPQLRRIDVASDLAFLIMDLEAAGRADLAAHLVAAYRAAGGDPGDDALLAWLASYRAQVRAKVALLRAEQQTGAGRARSQADAQRLLALADRLIWRARGPVTIAVGGLSASGKTTLAQELARRTGLPHIASDVVRKAEAGLAPAQRGSAALYTAERNAMVYAELGHRAAAAPRGAVVDATFRSARDRAGFCLAHAGAARVLYVECVAPRAVRLARARARASDPAQVSDAGTAVTRTQVMEPRDEVPPHEHVVVRGDGDIELQIRAIADALDRALLTTYAGVSGTLVSR
jgi:uncharacterized protein